MSSEEKSLCKRAVKKVLELNGYADYDGKKANTCRMGAITHAHFSQMFSRSAREVYDESRRTTIWGAPRPWGYAFNDRYFEGLRFSIDLEDVRCQEMHRACANIVTGYANIQKHALLWDATSPQKANESLWYLEDDARSS